MVSAIFALCDEYVSRYAALDPLYAAGRGIAGDFGAVTDLGPEGIAARAQLVHDTLHTLETLTAAGALSGADRLAADHLRERLTAERDWHALDEPLRLLNAVYGPLRVISGNVEEARPAVEDAADWERTLARLAAVPVMLASWRAALALGLERGLPAARRQAVETALRADRLAGAPGVHARLLAEYGDGPLAVPLAKAAEAAHAGYAELAGYLRDEYAPRATERDGVGARRYAVASRLALGADVDLLEAYDWAWAELHAVEAELASEAARVTGGSRDVDAAIARVVIDIGLHLDLPVPEPDAARHGPQWTFEVARDVLATRGRCVPHRLDTEVVRYCGRPGQATAYKLGERAWLAAREEARAREGAAFDLRRWHRDALDLGPIGLGLLPEALRTPALRTPAPRTSAPDSLGR